MTQNNSLYYGDNLKVLRESIASDSIDLIYLDPPFNSNANYNILFKAPSGEQSKAQIEAFEDTWRERGDSSNIFHLLLAAGHRVMQKLDALPAARARRFPGDPQ